MADLSTQDDAAGPSNARAKPRKARKKAPRELRWTTYIHKLLKQVHPELQISTDGLTVLSDALDDLMVRLASECQHLVQSNDRATLSARDVEAAVRLLIPPGEVQTLAVKQGQEAVAHSESNRS